MAIKGLSQSRSQKKEKKWNRSRKKIILAPQHWNLLLIKLQLLPTSVLIFFCYFSIFSSWIRVRIMKVDPDPWGKMIADPQPCKLQMFCYLTRRLSYLQCFGSIFMESGSSQKISIRIWNTLKPDPSYFLTLSEKKIEIPS